MGMEYTITGSNDFSGLTFDELQELLQLVQDTDREIRAEVGRRSAIAAIPAQVGALVEQYLGATGRESGSEWVQPTGAHDAYPKGWRVTHADKLWESLIEGNVWQPGNPADPQAYRWWGEIVAEPEEPGEEPGDPSVAEWNPNGVNYTRDAQVTFEGVTYVCLQPHASQPGWTPAAVPALWRAL